MWVPAVPFDGPYHQKFLAAIEKDGEDAEWPPLRSFKLLVELPNVHREADLDTYADRDTLPGMIINEIESVGAEEKRMLKASYPGTNFDTCWILEEGRHPADTGELVGFFGGGLAFLGGGIFLIRRGRKKTVQPQPLPSPELQAEFDEEQAARKPPHKPDLGSRDDEFQRPGDAE